MPDGVRLPTIPLSTVIVLVTALAGIVGTWADMSARIKSLTDENKEMQAHINAVDSRLVSAEREFARMEVRFENLRDSLNDLRQR